MIVQTKLALAFAVCILGVSAASAREVKVAVAANFTAPMKEIAAAYEKETGNKVLASFGGTGAFYAQIKNGAPYQILFAADAKTPAKIVKEGLGLEGTNKTYALGKLVLWSPKQGFVKDNKDFILSAEVNKIAVADPRLAPYGEAAYQTMEKWGNLAQAKSKFVTGDNVGKAFQFVKTGNTPVGFIALSQVFKDGKLTNGSGWIIPSDLYEPIKQDLVILNPGKNSGEVEKFMEFMKSPQVRKIIESYGYAL